MTLLSVSNVSKRFGGIQALQGISFDVGGGEVLGIIGANGAGKTTLFSLIAGNDRPTEGQIRLHGKPIDHLRPDQRCRAGIARTFQIVRPFAGLTVLENVLIPVLFGATRERNQSIGRSRAVEILAEVGLSRRLDTLASSLTLSDQKRLEIARALATDPALIMLDEVMAGLTATEVNELLEAVRGIKERRRLTVLLVEHVMQAVMRLSDRVIVLHHGQLIASGEPASVARDPRVIEVYLGKAK